MALSDKIDSVVTTAKLLGYEINEDTFLKTTKEYEFIKPNKVIIITFRFKRNIIEPVDLIININGEKFAYEHFAYNNIDKDIKKL